MELNLLPILNFDGKRMQINENVEIIPQPGDAFSLSAPVKLSATAENVGGTIEIIGSAEARLTAVCDRCAEEFELPLVFSFEERFKKLDEFSEADENPDISPLDGTAVDISEIIYTNLYMNLPSKLLCSEDCKGLCPVCGKNLNKGSCSCEADTTDPRFDVLDKLLGE